MLFQVQDIALCEYGVYTPVTGSSGNSTSTVRLTSGMSHLINLLESVYFCIAYSYR